MWTSGAGKCLFFFFKSMIQRKVKTTFSSTQMLSKCRYLLCFFKCVLA